MPADSDALVGMDVEERYPDKEDEFLQYLLQTTCKPALHIPIYRRVMTIQEDERICHAFKRLSTEGFLSAPVLDSWHRYKGFITIMDLVKAVSKLFYFHTTEEWVDFWEKETWFRKTTVKDIMNMQGLPGGRHTTPSPLYQSMSTFRALEVMVLGDHHRLAVVDDTTHSRVLNIFTQSMFISELEQRIDMVPQVLRKMEVKDFMPTTRVFLCAETDKAMQAFHTMAVMDLSALAIVNEKREMTGVLSIRDLRAVGMSGENFSRLFLPVMEYKKLALGENKRLAPRSSLDMKQVPNKPMFVLPQRTLEDCIRLMSDGNLHRLFVVDKEDSPFPISVVSQSDILRTLWAYYTGRTGSFMSGRSAGEKAQAEEKEGERRRR